MPKPKSQRTPEEQKRVDEAQAFIRQREKLASQRGGDNIGAVREAGRAMVAGEDIRVKAEQINQTAQANLPLLKEVGKPAEILPPEPQNLTPAEQFVMNNPVLRKLSTFGGELRQAGEGAIGAGIGQAGIGAVGGGTLGAIAGGAPAIPLAAVGFAGGFIRGYTGKLKENLNENIKVQYETLPKNIKNLRMIIADTNNGADAITSLQLFNQQLGAIDEAQSNLHLETQKDLNKFLGIDTQVELGNFEIFNAAGGARELLIRRMQEAVLTPNPNGNFNLLDETDFAGEDFQ